MSNLSDSQILPSISVVSLLLGLEHCMEKSFNSWFDNSVDMYFTDTDGKVYNFHYTENGTAKTVDLNLLYTLVGNDTPIVLTEE